MERLKNKVLNLNLKKSFVVLVIVGAIFGVGSGIALHQNFGDRILQIEEYDKQQKEEWLQSLEQYNREAGEQSQVLEWEWHDHDDYYGDWSAFVCCLLATVYGMGLYCSHCGAAYQQECRHCHASLQKDSNFCPNCGKAMKEVVSDNGQK